MGYLVVVDVVTFAVQVFTSDTITADDLSDRQRASCVNISKPIVNDSYTEGSENPQN